VFEKAVEVLVGPRNWKVPFTRRLESLRYGCRRRAGFRACRFPGLPSPGFVFEKAVEVLVGPRNWKVPFTRRLESLRYGANFRLPPGCKNLINKS
jgi:hypothetical protein